MRTKYKPWAKPYFEEHEEEISLPVLELSKLNHINLEIGCGKGQFILDMSRRHPDKMFIAVERNITCVGFTAKKLVEEEIKNVKLLAIDGEIVLDTLKDGSVDILYLNFSDPWPKKRHEKRRLTHPLFLEKYYRVLASDGEIRFKTDNDELFFFSKEMFDNDRFYISSLEEDYQLQEDDVMTEYEKKKRDLGLKIHRIIVRKK